MVEDKTPIKKKKPTAHTRLRLTKAKETKMKASQKSSANVKKSTKQKRESDDAVKSRVPRVKQSTLRKPPRPKAKFRKRQIHKAWLPTHLFHAKRAHMTPPKQPLWRMAIPLSPTAKSYRPTHRASGSRSAVAWDISYMSTIGLDGPDKSINNLLRAVGVYHDVEKDTKRRDFTRWNAGTRSWNGWLYEREAWPSKPIAIATVVKRRSLPNSSGDSDHGQTKKKVKSKAFIRVHPSAFLRVWEETLRLSKIQKPPVSVEDLRWEIGSIEVTGPASTEALVGTLWPVAHNDDDDKDEGCPEVAWPKLSTVCSPSSLPTGALLAFEFSDARLHHPPPKVTSSATIDSHNQLTQLLATWPLDRTQGPPGLFERASRLSASRGLPSQKAINRRKALAPPGAHPEKSTTDPKIPVMLLANNHASQGMKSWTVLLPWKCILPVWYSMMYYPLSTGDTIRFGGLDELRQVTYEAGKPWFPGDFPGLGAGLSWEMQERERRKKDWERRPKGKRVEWTSLDLGNGRRGEIGMGWACDWERLVHGPKGDKEDSTKVFHLPLPYALDRLKAPRDVPVNGDQALVAVTIFLLAKGVPKTCARIYRLPTSNDALRDGWLSQRVSQSARKMGKENRPHVPRVSKDAPQHQRRQQLAANLLDSSSAYGGGGKDYPVVPDEEDLVGFVTTGNFNLAEGRGKAVGSVLLDKVFGVYGKDGSGIPKAAQNQKVRLKRLCIVRNSGQSLGRLAELELA